VSLRLESGDVIHSFWVPQLGGKRDVNPVVRVPEGEEAKRNWMHFTIREEGVFWGQCAEFCGEAHSLMGIRVVAESEEEFRAWVDDWRTPAATANAPEPPAGDETGGQEAAEAGAMEAGRVEAGAAQAVVEEDPLVARGREVFFTETNCMICHAIQGTIAPGVIGPNLTRIGSRSTIAAGLLENTPENLERWIRDPLSVKPGAEMPGAQYSAVLAGAEFPATNLNDEQIRALAAYLSSMR
jgi:cytochrome c oxidase subunit 2